MPAKMIETIAELKSVVREFQQKNRTIGVVPTMGALHSGHLSLAEYSLKEADETIATIFVNPTQFSPSEDLDQYPRTLAADVEQLEALGVKFVFAPAPSEIYPGGNAAATTSVVPSTVAKKLEGEFRPSHFKGVATVVLKLLNLTEADFAYFGQKDFQQVMVVKQMVADLNVPVEIRTCPIIRDPDGLALSSRNVYLSEQEREVALSLNQTLTDVENQIRGGQRDGFEIITEMRQSLIDAGVDSIDYALVANPMTLVTMDTIQLPVVALIAAYVGKTRLIDNRLIE